LFTKKALVFTKYGHAPTFAQPFAQNLNDRRSQAEVATTNAAF